ncbi:GNAT family N-acetyltransferase [Aliarcobacter butzleri]|uniref:GNAT family N-acetyltransferase n=1 Tax=Aliarcobacter butzleri TaxID=28197 RepID=UPI00244BF8D2|nr:GNAT family N-acetyltransferase [Aliarcobacter butzleri]MDH1975665.1 GNAT family N-acetyltransferase [Aliarcobacter butzleri]MDN5105876.1 GNAT family N-acetyltransferase [Aliarcobacter butzleri]
MIRKAKVSDAQQICNVLRRSIIELCELDHQKNQKELDEWLANKTIQNCEAWINNKKINFFVAENDGKIVGVSSINHNGFLELCYILPEAKGLGFGGELLKVAEDSVLDLGIQVFTLESTLTAKGFYQHFGYIQTGIKENSLSYMKFSK